MYQQRPERESSKDSRKRALFAQLLTSIDRQFSREDEIPQGIGDWATGTPIMHDGRPFTFDKHEYQIDPYSDPHPFQVEMKATQLGQSTKAILRVLYATRYRRMKGILYLFPSRTDVLD